MNIIRKRKSYKSSSTITHCEYTDAVPLSKDIKSLIENYNKSKLSQMIDHQSEWNGGYDPVKEGHPLLPRGQSNNGWTSYSPTAIANQPKENKEPNENKLCICSSRDLFHFGCKCGGK